MSLWLHHCVSVESVSAALKEDGGVSPALERLLLSGDLYCGVFSSHALSGVTAPPRDLGSLLQLLSRYDLIPLHTETQKPVDETQLSQKPINMVREPYTDACSWFDWLTHVSRALLWLVTGGTSGRDWFADVTERHGNCGSGQNGEGDGSVRVQQELGELTALLDQQGSCLILSLELDLDLSRTARPHSHGTVRCQVTCVSTAFV